MLDVDNASEKSGKSLLSNHIGRVKENYFFLICLFSSLQMTFFLKRGLAKRENTQRTGLGVEITVCENLLAFDARSKYLWTSVANFKDHWVSVHKDLVFIPDANFISNI